MTLDRETLGFAGIPLVLVGLAVASAAFIWLMSERRQPAAEPESGEEVPPARLTRVWWWCLVLALVIGTLVRVVGLGERGLSHPEAYIPGLDLPAGISEPPPRHAFVETVVWHFRSEPHPFGYYLAMWVWTSLFGATLTSIRMPEMILGVLSIWLTYRVGALAYSPRVGVVAAGLLGLHGFHTFWSQAARMYAPGAFLGLLSTWLLLLMTRRAPPRRMVEVAYVATTVAGAMTVEFFWPFLCAQILWTVLNHTSESERAPRVAVLESAAFMLASPMLSHAAMLGRGGATPEPSAAFLRNYFSFGFLFQNGAYSEASAGFFELPTAIALGVCAVSVALLVSGLSATRATSVAARQVPSLRALGLCAVGMWLVMLGLAIVSYVRHTGLAVLSVAPLAAFLIPLGAGRIRPWLTRVSPVARGLLREQPALTSLVPLLAIVPALVMFVVSYQLTLTASRAFLIFVPYLLIVIAAGAVRLSNRRAQASVVAALLAGLFSASTVILHRMPISPRDYQGLARGIQARSQPGDLVFAPGSHWGYTPLFYYLDHRRLVTQDFRAVLKRVPGARVWLPTFRGLPTAPDAVDALSGYRAAESVSVLGGVAVLMVP